MSRCGPPPTSSLDDLIQNVLLMIETEVVGNSFSAYWTIEVPVMETVTDLPETSKDRFGSNLEPAWRRRSASRYR
jgi:hypothetical protein